MIAVVKYGGGNIFSVQAVLKRLNAEAVITADAGVIKKASRVILPGVGAADRAAKELNKTGLGEIIKNLKQPVLGICLGMQIMCLSSEEGNAQGLGIFKVKVKRFMSSSFKIPHMGWNNISELKSPLFKGLENNSFVYFVHSYYAPLCQDTAAEAVYIHPFSAALHAYNFYGVQFHPEKSAAAGGLVIKNFLGT